MFKSYLGSTLLHCTSEDELFLKKGYICHISSYFGKGKVYLLFMEFCKWDPEVISTAHETKETTFGKHSHGLLQKSW
jgi:hypothetical protein